MIPPCLTLSNIRYVSRVKWSNPGKGVVGIEKGAFWSPMTMVANLTYLLLRTVMYSYGPPHKAVQKQDDQLELTYSNYVRTQDVTPKTCRRWWMIGRSGERGSGISVLVARHDDMMMIIKNDITLLFNKNHSFLSSQRVVLVDYN